MKDLEFREKTYEKYFFAELARMTNQTFSPDQMDENKLGFDDAFMLPSLSISRRILYISRARARRFSGLEINELGHIADELAARMPQFRCNLFVQYKRPRHLESPGAAKWSNWKRPYYEYTTTLHQHEALRKIHSQAAGRAQVVYAAPAFWTAKSLFDFAQKSTIISHSNIANVTYFGSHRKYTYADPGNIGLGHSESTEIRSETIPNLINFGVTLVEMNFRDHILNLEKLIMNAIRDDQTLLSIYNRARDVNLPQSIDDSFIDIDSLRDIPSLLGALLAIGWFAEAFQIRIYCYA